MNADQYTELLQNCSYDEWDSYVANCPVRTYLEICYLEIKTRCDGATFIDGVGFGKYDSLKIRSLMGGRRVEGLTNPETLYLARILLRYRRQLERQGQHYPRCLFRGYER